MPQVKRITLDVDVGRLFDATREVGQQSAGARMLELVFLAVGPSFRTELALAAVYGVEIISVENPPAAFDPDLSLYQDTLIALCLPDDARPQSRREVFRECIEEVKKLRALGGRTERGKK